VGEKMSLFIYAAYAIGLILTAILVIPAMGVFPTLWFIFYLVAGIYTINSAKLRIYYFLANILVSIILFIVSLKFLVALIGLVAGTGFVLSFFALSQKQRIYKSKQKIKEIIDEVVSKKEEAPQVRVYSTRIEPAKEAPAKKIPKKTNTPKKASKKKKK
jgi:uncharacterized membrane protein YgaE (UPF0421/DUF939 family)